MQEVRVRVPGLNNLEGKHLKKLEDFINKVYVAATHHYGDDSVRLLCDHGNPRLDRMECDFLIEVRHDSSIGMNRGDPSPARLLGERLRSALDEAGYEDKVLTVRHSFLRGGKYEPSYFDDTIIPSQPEI